ncbi:MAG: CDP-glycerol glycerophosphotransferase family protein [Burkholderiaceae bacterium]
MLTSIQSSAAETDSVIEQRLEGLETMGVEVCNAIENLADMLVKLQQQVSARADTPQPPELTKLIGRIQQLELQAQLQSTCTDLAKTSRFYPKRASVVFVGTTYFGCNAKYGWLGFRDAAREAGVECWFLPQTSDQEAAVQSLGEACFPVNPNDWQARHITAALSAAVVVTCDHLLNPNPFAASLLAGARHVQLWHGISIKEIGLGNLRPLRDMNPHIARVMATCGPFEHFIGTSAAQEPEFRRWFGLQHYAPIGYPRNDVLLREPTQADLLGVDVSMLAQATATRRAGRRVVLYAPTFRDARPGAWIIDAGLERLASELEKLGDTLLVAMHPVEAPLIPQLRAAVPAARFVTPRTDLYPLMREVDVLVTDYSSIMFDFLLLDRPIALFRPDHDDYVRRSRQLHDEKLIDAKPGPLATTVNQLLKTLHQRDARGAEHAAARSALRERLFDHADGSACERLNALLFEEIERTLRA